MSKRRKSSRQSELEGQARGYLQQKSKRAPLSPEEVRDELMEGVTVDTLIALGVLTPKGGASPSARRKVKQVKHLLQQVERALTDLFDRYDDPVIIDMGAGRATVSLALYDQWIRVHGRGRLIAVESRAELVNKVKEATQENYPRFEMIEGSALECELPSRVHLVLGLHACDLATDHAIARAILSKADYVALVPCCQAEFAQSLKRSNLNSSLSSLWTSPHHRREFGAHLTNVTRVLALRSVGYSVSVTELTGWEHSMKNELIIGRRVGRYQRDAQEQLLSLLTETGLILAETIEETQNSQSDLSPFNLSPFRLKDESPWLIKRIVDLVIDRDKPSDDQSIARIEGGGNDQ